MKKEFHEFKSSVDNWIKELRSEISGLKNMNKNLSENIDNTDYNYELVTDLKDEVYELRQELKLLKLMQIAMTEKKMQNFN